MTNKHDTNERVFIKPLEFNGPYWPAGNGTKCFSGLETCMKIRSLLRKWQSWCFNPSYRGIGFWSAGDFLRGAKQPGVSILLIVELAFEETICQQGPSVEPGFNPSYRGIGFWRWRNPAEEGGGAMFQSFLSWNWLLKILITLELPNKIIVSILLIVELAFEDRGGRYRKRRHQLFQSFLSWNWLLKIFKPWRTTNNFRSFNPSYRGIGFWRTIFVHCRKNLISFQSFLSWNWLLKNMTVTFYFCLIVVSILLIVELAFEGENLILFGVAFIVFQSFLSWNWLLKSVCIYLEYRRAAVSILLIVELAFEGLMACRSLSLPSLFQSFLSWNWPLKCGSIRRHACFYPRFNPSYRGIGFWSYRHMFSRIS